MKKIGLALSGGGFRASLYHLGLLRFLRDAGILSDVTHISSVSGGSVIAAHVVLNWDRYNGSAEEFDAVAAEFLSFVRLDIRNRIARRFPMGLALSCLRKPFGLSNRGLTRAGLLEEQYKKFLYGDVSLFEMRQSPQLHILATSLSEGCLCSFNQRGLLLVRPQPGLSFRLDQIQIGLGTVAMAVAASSAYPGFFPPLELTAADVGAREGEFGRQSYTDGGIFDNLGIRMFHCLERALMADAPLADDDFVDLRQSLDVLHQAAQLYEETPLRRLMQVLTATGSRAESSRLLNPALAPPISSDALKTATVDADQATLSRLREVMRKYQFYYDPLFANLKLADPSADSFWRACRANGRILDVADRLWLNRHVLDAAFRDATGRPCFRRLNSGLDGVLVSDVGKPFEVQNQRRAGGLIRTALRGQRHSDGPRVATGEGNLLRHSWICFRADHRRDRTQRRPDGVES